MPPPDWAYHLEHFDPPPDEELVCSICEDVLCDPVETPCLHGFCRKCILKWLDRSRNCPICRKCLMPFHLKEVMLLVKNMIMKLTLHCKDCNEKITLESSESHVKECIFQMVPCSNSPCQISLMRLDIQDHVLNECAHRLVDCKYSSRGCTEKIPLSSLEIHVQQDCQYELRQCVNSPCQSMLMPKDILKHSFEECLYYLVRCENTIRGCKEQVPLFKSETHFRVCPYKMVQCATEPRQSDDLKRDLFNQSTFSSYTDFNQDRSYVSRPHHYSAFQSRIATLIGKSIESRPHFQDSRHQSSYLNTHDVKPKISSVPAVTNSLIPAFNGEFLVGQNSRAALLPSSSKQVQTDLLPVDSLYHMSDSPKRKSFLDQLIKFHEKRGSRLTHCPTINRVRLDLYALYLLVKINGGFAEVMKSHMWPHIGRLVGTGTSPSALNLLRRQYEKLLLAYECKFDERGATYPSLCASLIQQAYREDAQNIDLTSYYFPSLNLPQPPFRSAAYDLGISRFPKRTRVDVPALRRPDWLNVREPGSDKISEQHNYFDDNKK